MPPEIMISVMLMARMPVVDICKSTLEIFNGLRNATLATFPSLTPNNSTR